MGALADGASLVMNDDIVRDISLKDVQAVIEAEKKELKRQSDVYRRGKQLSMLTGKKIILVDDGIATGACMKAALASLKNLRTGQVTIAVPVAPTDVHNELSSLAYQIKSVCIADDFHSVGAWYEDFSQTKDQDVITLLEQSILSVH